MRHFSCEKCDTAVKGGFDPSTNQVSYNFIVSIKCHLFKITIKLIKIKNILCYNTLDSHRSEEVANILIGSLIQSYDYCRSNYNMFDLRHLACTQVGLN